MLQVGTRKETPYVSLERVSSIPSRLEQPVAHALLAARRNSVVDVRLLDGTIVEGLRLTKGIVYEVEFREIVKIFPTLEQAELWAFYLPEKIKGVQYV